MKKRILSMLILVLCISGFLFAGGGSQSRGSQAAAGPVNIELWYGLSMTESPPLASDWKGYQLLRDKLNINLTADALPSSGNDQDVRINAAAAANALPEIFMVSRPVLVNIVRTGVVGQVDDLYAQMPNRTRLMHTPEARAFTTINGKNYGFAATSTIARNEGVLIRKDWLTKLGLNVPVTLDDYFNVMRAFTTNDPDGNGTADTYGFGSFIELDASYEEGLGRRFEPIMGAFNVAGTWNMSRANAGLNVRKPAMFDALTYVKRMVDERVIDPNWISYTKDDFRANWKQGRFGIMREQFAAYSSESNYAPFDQNFPNGEWMIIDPPAGAGGQKSVGVFPDSYRIYSTSAKAIQEGKGPAIAKLLEWMVSDADDGGYYLCGWGEKGVNFVMGADGAPTADGVPDPSKGWSRPEIVSITQLRNMVFYNSDIELISRYPSFKTSAGRTMNMLEILADMQGRAWTPNNGSASMPLPGADLQRFYRQGVIEFVTGARQLTQANWDAWVAEFDRLGGIQWENDGKKYAEDNGLLQ